MTPALQMQNVFIIYAIAYAKMFATISAMHFYTQASTHTP
jgi:hypothetical protein